MKTLPPTQAIAPGKLILSGEHAVVYGNPALVMAVNRYVMTTIEAQKAAQVSFHLPGLVNCHFPFATVLAVKDRLRKDYQRYLHGDLPIREVLHEPVELAQFVLGQLLEVAGMQTLEGMSISIQSDIPLGCGMGSSAAVVISLMSALAHYLQITLSPEEFFQLAHAAENMQHGKSSGIDLHTVMRGGCLYFKKDQISARMPPALPLYLINTGQPQTTTGECVAAVAPYFKTTLIGNDFAAVTYAMDKALQLYNFNEVIIAVRENHKLLNTIGVVPERVQQLIAEIEQAGGAAKISGAGAIAGNNAGIVLIAIEDDAILQKIAKAYQYDIALVQCESQGAYVNENFCI